MKIGWLIPTVGAFGAVREMVEISNVWARAGHEVTIYHPDGGPVTWLPSAARTADLRQLSRAEPDALIGIIDWRPNLFAALRANAAAIKAVCLMGFEPSEAMAAALRGEGPASDPAWRMMREAIEEGMAILADSSWQTAWLAEHVGVEAGPPFGGVNLAQFRPAAKRKRDALRVAASGDPRTRKGSDTVYAAMDLVQAELGKRVEFVTYWGRRLDQSQLAEFLQQADVFVDGHRRGGWCNPVAEAMACGAACVCTQIGATADFAVHEQTALVIPADDAKAMAAAILRLAEDDGLRRRAAAAGLTRISEFDYEIVAPRLARFLEERLYSI